MKVKKFKTAPNGEPVIEACENKGIAIGLNKGYPITRIKSSLKKKQKSSDVNNFFLNINDFLKYISNQSKERNLCVI